MKRTVRILVCSFFIIETLFDTFVGYTFLISLFLFIVAFFHSLIGWRGIALIVSAETLQTFCGSANFSLPHMVFLTTFVWCGIFLGYCVHLYFIKRWKIRERCGIML